MLMRRLLALLLLALGSIPALAAQEPLIQPGDRLKVSCEEEPTLNKEYGVTSDGLILVDFLGAVQVKGLTERQAAIRLSDRLVNDRILQRATVKVSIVRVLAKTIRVRGHVLRAGEMPLTEGMRLADAIKVAGVREGADLSAVAIKSSEGKVSTVDFTKHQAGSTANNPLLSPGDEITFQATQPFEEVFVLGGVAKPGAMDLTPGLTLRQAIERAGGYTIVGLPSKVRVERANEPAVVYDLTIPSKDLKLEAKDRVFVETRGERVYVHVSGEVVTPRALEVGQGIGLAQAIQQAGGLTPRARLDKVRVIPEAGKSSTYDLRPIQQGLKGDVPLKPGDRVEVMAKGRSEKDARLALGIGLILLLFGR